MNHHCESSKISTVFDFLGLIHQSLDDGIIKKKYAMLRFSSPYGQLSLVGEITPRKLEDKTNSTVKL